jgi:hypothetical protein
MSLGRNIHRKSFSAHDIAIGIGCLSEGDTDTRRFGTANSSPSGGHYIRFSFLIIRPHNPDGSGKHKNIRVFKPAFSAKLWTTLF